jgi:protein arginine kinase activator
MRCRACPRVAVVQVTEVLGDDRFEKLHFCEECGRRYLAAPLPEAGGLPVDPDDFADAFAADPAAPVEPDLGGGGVAFAAADIDDDPPGGQPCEVCGLKFVEFRNSGRLGCPHDYDHFREELLPLLESIHGDTAHAGKAPRGPDRPAKAHDAPAGVADPAELPALKKKLSRAVRDEDYEAAARLRDRIRELEGA